jgi:Ulp1 family protease
MLIAELPIASMGHLPAYVFNDFKTKDEIQTNWAAQVDLERISGFFVPLHINGNHWALGLIDMQLDIFSIFDSLNHGVEIKYTKDVTRDKLRRDEKGVIIYSKNESVYFAIRYFDELYTLKGKALEEKIIIEHIEIPQQKNALDCGVFTLMYAYNIVTNEGQFDMEQFTQEAVHEFRNKIITEVETAQL